MINIQENIQLAPLTTFKVGGPAQHFVEVKTKEELKEAIELSEKNDWKSLILAGGSNLIISDAGFDGLVVKINIVGLDIDGDVLTAGAAVEMKELVDASIDASLAGLEWAGGLPGSFGGAIRGNAGAFGGEIKDTILEVETFSLADGFRTFNKTECQFDYRESFFKHSDEVIISAKSKLQKGHKDELRKVADSRIQYRQDKHPMNYPNSGSIFKNVPLENVPKEHLPLFEDAIKNDPFPIVPTAKIIAVAGLKGKKVGDAQLSEKHSNYIVNLGNAKSNDIIELIKQIQQEISERYQIILEVEPEIVK